MAKVGRVVNKGGHTKFGQGSTRQSKGMSRTSSEAGHVRLCPASLQLDF
jgi:hypothetical protein